MKAFLRDKQSFIYLSANPSKDVLDGLVIHLEPTHKLERAITDIRANVRRYDIPEHMRGHIVKLELKEE